MRRGSGGSGGAIAEVLHQHQTCSTCYVGVLCRKGLAGNPSASALTLALQQLRFQGLCSSAGRNRVHAQSREVLEIIPSLESHSSGLLHQRSGVREVARARRRGHLAKFGVRGGVRRRAETRFRDARGVRGLGGLLTCHWHSRTGKLRPLLRHRNFPPFPKVD